MAVARPSLYRSRRLKLQVFRGVTFLLAAVFFLVPIIAMLEFSTRGNNNARTLEYWQSIFSYPDLFDFNFGPAPTAAIDASLELALVTSLAMLVLLVPTMVWVRLKLRRLSRVLEFVCLLPLTIPAIVLVVGLFPMYIWLGTNVSDSILTLALAYVVLVLPYCYRALDAGLGAIDVKTLSEAARSLGASWFSVMWRIIVPNISNAILNATLLSVALVLGEYTIANNLLYNNLQVELVHLARANAGVSIAVAVASLLFAFVLLIAISLVGGRPRRTHSEAVTNFGSGPVQGSAG
jgi:putative spermidine/putrescine transport system permease protein